MLVREKECFEGTGCGGPHVGASRKPMAARTTGPDFVCKWGCKSKISEKMKEITEILEVRLL
jgi:hypothetical protein